MTGTYHFYEEVEKTYNVNMVSLVILVVIQ